MDSLRKHVAARTVTVTEVTLEYLGKMPDDITHSNVNNYIHF
jgi:hypothetical protein